jgi:hypothetical protein
VDWFTDVPGLLRSLLATAVDGIVDGIEMLPGLLLAYVILTVSAGLAGRLLRRRGRLGGMYSLGGALAVVFFAVFSWVGIAASNHVNSLSDLMFTLVDVTGSAAVAGIVVVAVCAALPGRRRGGPIRWVNTTAMYGVRSLGVLIGVAAIPAVVVAMLSVSYAGWVEVVPAVVVAVLGMVSLIAIGGFIVLGADRLKLSAADHALSADREPVLYVRPFGAEWQPFHIGEHRERETFEQFLGDEVTARIGPLVALGNPTDRIAPAGAVRVYTSDTGWRAEIERFAVRSRCVLAIPVTSPSTDWELAYLRRTGQHRKLFILTPPEPAHPDVIWGITRRTWTGEVKVRLVHLHLALYQGCFGTLYAAARHGAPSEPAVERRWPDLSATLIRCGYRPGADPGAGAVLAFDADGTALVVGRSLTGADQYIAAVRDRLDTA